jgi:hypothetical protein
VDANHNDGVDGFLFLAPLVSQPDKGGQAPVPELTPHVVVCELETDTVTGDQVCVDEAGASRTFSGTEVVYHTDHYKVEWDTQDPAWTIRTSEVDGPQYTYRLTVYLGSIMLGLVDLQFGDNGGTAKNLTDPEAEIIGLKDGRTVPVNFFIGEDLLTYFGCGLSGLDCRVTTIDPTADTTIVTRDGDAAIYIPAGALPPIEGDESYVLTISEVPPSECNLGVPITWFNSCYEYDLLPNPTEKFNDDVIVAQCIDTEAVQAFYGANWEAYEDELVLGARHGDIGAPGTYFELLPNVPEPATLSCDDYTPGANPSGTTAFLQDAGRGLLDFFFGQAAYAGHTGFGGSTRDLSTIAWVDPGLRIAGLDLARGGWSSIEDDRLDGAMAALGGYFLDVWPTTAPTLDKGLLHHELDVVVLGSVLDGANIPIAELSPAEQDSLMSFVEHGGCAILLTDNGSFSLANASLLQQFGLTVSGTKGANTGATPVAGLGPLMAGVSTLVQNYPGSIHEPDPLSSSATVIARQSDDKAAAAMIAAGGLGADSGPVFAFSDVNMFWSNSAVFTGGRWDSANNAQLFLNVVDACGPEPKLNEVTP